MQSERSYTRLSKISVDDDPTTLAFTLTENHQSTVYVGKLDSPESDKFIKISAKTGCIDRPIILPARFGQKILAQRRACRPDFGRSREDFNSSLVLIEWSESGILRESEIATFADYAAPLGVADTQEGLLLVTVESDEYQHRQTGTQLFGGPLAPSNAKLRVYATTIDLDELNLLYTTKKKAIQPFVIIGEGVAFRVAENRRDSTSFSFVGKGPQALEFENLMDAVNSLQDIDNDKFIKGLSRRFATSSREGRPASQYSWPRANKTTQSGGELSLPFLSLDTAFAPGANKSIYAKHVNSDPESSMVSYVIVNHDTDTVSELRYLRF